MKMLVVNPSICTGCRACELACSFQHEKTFNPAKSRIHVLKFEREGLDIPIVCVQCEDAPCIKVCPVGALSREKELDAVKVDYDLCIGCRQCTAICPFGGIGYNADLGKVIKCDLCEGNPNCVRYCPAKAVQYIDATKALLKKKQVTARKLARLMESPMH